MRRLYYLFPDIAHTEKVVEELLLKRIDIKHMHGIAQENIDLASSCIPEASIFQKNDVRHSLLIGLGVGGILGVLAAIAFHRVLELELGGFMVLIPLIGLVFGGWAATMIGVTTPNVELRPFQQALEKGCILLIIDVPKVRVDDIEKMVEKMHPESAFKGEEPTMPTFP